MGKAQRSSGGSMKTTFNLNNFSNVAFCTQNRKTTVKSKLENTKKAPTVRRGRRVSDNAVIAIISLIALFVALYSAYRYALWREHEHEQTSRKCNSKLRALLIAPENSTAIHRVFERLDYDMVNDTRDPWDVLWNTAVDSFDRHVTVSKPQQLVIQFPADLANVSSPHHLRTFALPEMKRALRDGPRFIIKNCLVNGTDDAASSVVQELVGDPLILDGRLVETRAVVLVTSVNPLRVYRPRDDLKVLFTPDYESLPKHFCLKSIRDEATAQLLTAAHRTTLDDNIDEAVVATLLLSEQSTGLSNLQQSLQLMEFRFVIDTNFGVHITDVKGFVESNGSIDSEEDFERIIYGALKIAGAGSFYEFSCRASLECRMLSTLKDIVSANSCINYPCNASSCTSAECELCLPCLNQMPDALNHLHRSFREHMQRGIMRRVFPSQKHSDDGNIVNQLSPANRLSMKWFRAKCDADGTWC